MKDAPRTPPPPTRRLFTAVLPSERASSELDARLAPLRPASTNPPRPPRWLDPAGWHVTLLFTPVVDDALVPRYVDALATMAARHHGFGLAVRGAGAYPRPEAARHLVALLDDPDDALPGLAAGCREAAAVLGIGFDDRPYQPHLTLARANRGADLTSLVDALQGLATEAWRVCELALVESTLHAHGSRYTTIARLPLG